MICNCIEELSIKYLDRSLEDYLLNDFKSHIQSCKKCRNKFIEIKSNYDPSLNISEIKDFRYSVMDKLYSKDNNSVKHRLPLKPFFIDLIEVIIFISILVFIPILAKHSSYSNTPKVALNNNQNISAAQSNEKASIDITLKDGLNIIDKKNLTSNDVSVITSTDIKNIINILKDLGAKSISINDITINENTPIEPYGQFIMINNIKYTSPFTVKILGKTNNSLNKENIENRITDYLATRNPKINVNKTNNNIIKSSDLTAEQRQQLTVDDQTKVQQLIVKYFTYIQNKNYSAAWKLTSDDQKKLYSEASAIKEHWGLNTLKFISVEPTNPASSTITISYIVKLNIDPAPGSTWKKGENIRFVNVAKESNGEWRIDGLATGP